MSRAQGEECNLGADTISVNAAVAGQVDVGRLQSRGGPVAIRALARGRIWLICRTMRARRYVHPPKQ